MALVAAPVQLLAQTDDGGWLERFLPDFHLLNDALLVDDEGGAESCALGFIEQPVLPAHILLPVAQDGEGDAELSDAGRMRDASLRRAARRRFRGEARERGVRKK